MDNETKDRLAAQSALIEELLLGQAICMSVLIGELHDRGAVDAAGFARGLREGVASLDEDERGKPRWFALEHIADLIESRDLWRGGMPTRH